MFTVVKEDSNDYSLNLQKIVYELSEIDSEQGAFDTFTRIVEILDVSYFTYGIMWPDDFHHIKSTLICNYEAKWVEQYNNKAYKLIDPRVRDCFISITPVYWSTQGPYLELLSPKAKKMMDDAYQHGIRSGVNIPLHCSQNIKGMFGVGINHSSYNKNTLQHLESITPFLSYLGAHVHLAMMRILKLDKICQSDPLSKREKDCLCWVADGKTAAEIAKKLFLAESTIKFHLKNIMKKLDAHNTSQALAIAILKGIIDPVEDNI